MLHEGKKRVLITGGAGFLGLHTAWYFAHRGWQCVLADIAEYNTQEYPDDCVFLKVDVRDKRALRVAMKPCQVVMHCAAALPLWPVEEIMSTNVSGTAIVLAVAEELGINRVIHISSTAVYGIPKKHPIVETDMLQGVGAYGISKIEAEKHCFKAIQRGMPVTIIRPKTFIGTARLGVFEILFDWIHDGKKIPVVGNGKNRYQLLDVADLVEVMYAFTQKDDPAYSDVFNIGAKKFSAIKHDLEAMFSRVGSSSRVFTTPAWFIKATLRFLEALGMSPLYTWVYETADKDSFVSTDKLEKVLQWHPRFSNVDALSASYMWYQEHYDEVKARGSGINHTHGWKQGALAIAKWFL